MNKITYNTPINYTYDINHKGAHYNIDGKYANAGEFLESCCKAHRGYEYKVNPATSYDKGSDIEQEQTSVKSGGASLACVYGSTVDEILKTYFENVASTKWIWAVQIDDTIIEYQMNRTEFKEFCNEFCGLAQESKTHKIKVRFRKTSSKMLKWLDERVA